MSNFSYTLQWLYHTNNPYHNAIHAADVVQFFYYLLHSCKAKELFNITTDIYFAIIISAAGHDVDHPGHNNWYELKSQSILATIYNDQSILENHHCATTFRVMKEKDSDILEHVEEPVRKKIREWVIELILATDMAKHFSNLNILKSR